jgi:hypothetical protein
MEEVILFLMQEGFASDVKSAIHIYEAMSDEWLDTIDEKLSYTQGQPLPKKDQEALKTIQQRLYGPGGPYEGKRGITSTGNRQSTPRVTLGDNSKPTTKRKVTRQTFEVK